jgi:biotin carboxyl carrier protein
MQIRSPAAGRCAAVLVAEGDLVGANDDIIVIETA